MSHLVEKEIYKTVDPNEPRSRLDVYLARQPLGLSRTQIHKLATQGNILVNQERGDPSRKVRSGDKILLRIPPPKVLTARAEPIPLKILHEDRHLAVIDKDAQIVVHAARDHAQGTLVNALLYHLKDLSRIGGELKPGIVHRLDKGTSGVMVVAKTNEAHLDLSRQFHDRLIEKTYLALAYGSFPQDQGTVATALGRSRGNRKKFSSKTRRGRQAKTQWKVFKRFEGMALLEVKPETGRTHQIRVHLAETGHPVVGDPLYGGKQWVQKLKPKIREAVGGLDHQALHAWKLKFQHPHSKKWMEFEAPLPKDLEQIIRILSDEKDFS